MVQKAKQAFRTISEAADDLDVPQHVLRFWETKFAQVKPLKRGGNRRYYRPEDINLLHAIKHQLYDEGHSIKEVQGLIREKGLKDFVDIWLDQNSPSEAPQEIAPPKTEEVLEFEPTLDPEPEPAPDPDPEPTPPPISEDDSIRVSKDLVKALVNDLRALRQLIDRLPD